MRLTRWAAGAAVLAAVLHLTTARPTSAIVFSDDFEYTVTRSEADKDTAFSGAGWGDIKSNPTDTGAKGYLYTVSAIDDGSGSGCPDTYPGTNSTRVLAIEALPTSLGGQTDFYMTLGGSSNYFPGDVWIQFWICPNRAGSQMSEFTEGKFFYFSKDGVYPSGDHQLMGVIGAKKFLPDLGEPHGNPMTLGTFFVARCSCSHGFPDLSTAAEGDQDKMGVTDDDDYAPMNTWTLIKMHIKTTSTSATGGNTFEVWARPYGTPTFEKWAEWIGGTTPNFTWAIDSGFEGGHHTLKMPTTINDGDFWMYMDDFTVASLEGDLPTYQDTGGASSGTIRLRIRGEM